MPAASLSSAGGLAYQRQDVDQSQCLQTAPTLTSPGGAHLLRAAISRECSPPDGSGHWDRSGLLAMSTGDRQKR